MSMTLEPGQMATSPGLIVTVGPVVTLTATEAVAVQPFALVTVTVKVPAVATVVEAVVSPFDHA